MKLVDLIYKENEDGEWKNGVEIEDRKGSDNNADTVFECFYLKANDLVHFNREDMFCVSRIYEENDSEGYKGI